VSVIHFSLVIEIATEDQYRKIVTDLIKKFPKLGFTVSTEWVDNGEKYRIETHDYAWANNLTATAKVLEKHDHKM
jgi:hypothetical protein